MGGLVLTLVQLARPLSCGLQSSRALRSQRAHCLLHGDHSEQKAQGTCWGPGKGRPHIHYQTVSVSKNFTAARMSWSLSRWVGLFKPYRELFVLCYLTSLWMTSSRSIHVSAHGIASFFFTHTATQAPACHCYLNAKHSQKAQSINLSFPCFVEHYGCLQKPINKK